jgi:hypothetical protein
VGEFSPTDEKVDIFAEVDAEPKVGSTETKDNDAKSDIEIARPPLKPKVRTIGRGSQGECPDFDQHLCV